MCSSTFAFADLKSEVYSFGKIFVRAKLEML